MRCYCCNQVLTPKESTRKFKLSGAYTDMCDSCLGTIDVETQDSKVLEVLNDDDDFNDYEGPW